MVARRRISLDSTELEVIYKEFAASDNSEYCSAEIAFSPNDRIILDEINMERLDRKLSLLLPAIAYSRTLSYSRNLSWGREESRAGLAPGATDE